MNNNSKEGSVVSEPKVAELRTNLSDLNKFVILLLQEIKKHQNQAVWLKMMRQKHFKRKRNIRC